MSAGRERAGERYSTEESEFAQKGIETVRLQTTTREAGKDDGSLAAHVRKAKPVNTRYNVKLLACIKGSMHKLEQEYSKTEPTRGPTSHNPISHNNVRTRHQPGNNTPGH